MIEYFSEPFVWRALLGGLLTVLLTTPLGCFVIWQRMAYFGDALAHSALLGVAIGLLMGVNPNWSVLAGCIVVALLLVQMQKHHRLGSELSVDTHLGIVAHAGLAGGLVLLSFVDNIRFDLEAYLFGDVLTVTMPDLWRMLTACVLLALTLFKLWKPLLLLTISEDVARVEGVPVARLRLIFIIMLAIVVAIAIQIVGVLLMGALLIVPAAAARRLSNTPERMVLTGILIGTIAVIAGVFSSLAWDLQTGPAIVLVALSMFVFIQFKRS
ncbi:MAG: metal ABC transporter permease [Gammaproteobacteria bacterium]|nr:metal ABC transporter permease [Gammaproteobacteria bacterium]